MIVLTPHQTVIQFKAVMSRTKNRYHPDRHAFPDSRNDTSGQNINRFGGRYEYRPAIDPRFGRAYRPNFIWRNLLLRINVAEFMGGDRLMVWLWFPLDNNGLPVFNLNGIRFDLVGRRFGPGKFDPSLLSTSARPRRHLEIANALRKTDVDPHTPYHFLSDDVVFDIRTKEGFDLFHRRDWVESDDWNPRHHQVRYVNLYEGDERHKTGGWNQGRKGYSARQFLNQYCQGGYRQEWDKRKTIPVATVMPGKSNPAVQICVPST